MTQREKLSANIEASLRKKLRPAEPVVDRKAEYVARVFVALLWLGAAAVLSILAFGGTRWSELIHTLGHALITVVAFYIGTKVGRAER